MGVEVKYMDLKNQKITVGELLDDPRSRAVFQRRFGQFLNHPMVKAGRSLTLEQLVALAGTRVEQKIIRETLEELKRA
jgi:hypothetical protein